MKRDKPAEPKLSPAAIRRLLRRLAVLVFGQPQRPARKGLRIWRG